jgi:hypothetical protein
MSFLQTPENPSIIYTKSVEYSLGMFSNYSINHCAMLTARVIVFCLIIGISHPMQRDIGTIVSK